MNLLRKYNKEEGLTSVVRSGEAGLKRIVFDMLKLKKGQGYFALPGMYYIKQCQCRKLPTGC